MQLVIILNNFHHLRKRLSIIDLSSKANQPMFSSNGDLCITFNGEIYNYLEIKKELEKKILSLIRIPILKYCYFV